MYEDYYRFNEKPFSLTPDPKFFYLSKEHQGALDHMLYGIKRREGFMVIAGDVGMGKTTLCRCLLERLGNHLEVALILNPLLSPLDLLMAIVQDLRIAPANIKPPPGTRNSPNKKPLKVKAECAGWVNRATKKELLDALNKFLIDQHNYGGSTLLIVDEAQNLSLDVLEQLRILSNFETDKDKLLQIIFVGQMEFSEKLRLPELKQLNQRISIRYEIAPLSKLETKNYINHRTMVAGGGSRVQITRSAFNEIYGFSKGYPRLINLVCDRALLAGAHALVEEIEATHVKKGIQSLKGEEDKGFFAPLGGLKSKLPLAASVLFFLAGVGFFSLSLDGAQIKQLGRDALAVLERVKAPTLAPVSGEDKPAKQEQIVEQPKPVVYEPVPEKQPRKRPIEFVPERSAFQKPVARKVALRNSIPVDPQMIEPDPVAIEYETEPPPEKVITELTDNFRIQVYSFTSRERADEEALKLRADGFQAFWKQAGVMGDSWFVVYVGPFGDIKVARTKMDELISSGRNPLLLYVSETG